MAGPLALSETLKALWVFALKTMTKPFRPLVESVVNVTVDRMSQEMSRMLTQFHRALTESQDERTRITDLHYRDVLLLLDRITSFVPGAEAVLETEHNIAIESDDHIWPRGTRNDNSRSPRFVLACERLFGRPLTFLDLGCAGGGLVLDFVLRGHRGFGIEGSDYSQRAQRAEWRILKNNLFTGDISKPFLLRSVDSGNPIRCEVISAWEFLEHIAEQDIPQVFKNVSQHLADDGLFVGSIALYHDLDSETGIDYHKTVRESAWWKKRFLEFGMVVEDDHGFAFEDFCRGTGNGIQDMNFRDQPGMGFHFVARKRVAE